MLDLFYAPPDGGVSSRVRSAARADRKLLDFDDYGGANRTGYFGIDVDEDVRDLDDQDFRRVTDLVVSYADENDLRYGSLSLEGIDGMALAARLRDVASR